MYIECSRFFEAHLLNLLSVTFFRLSGLSGVFFKGSIHSMENGRFCPNIQHFWKPKIDRKLNQELNTDLDFFEKQIDFF